MQKLLRRTAMAERQVARRAAKRKDWLRRDEMRYARLQQKASMTEISAGINAAVRARHEDWEMGPLAPNRDHLLRDAKGQLWGAVSVSRQSMDLPLTDEAKEARCAWAGGSKTLCLAKGDRAVIVEGPYKGKIGVISALDKEKCTVQMEGVVRTNVSLLDSQVGPEGSGISENPVLTIPDALPISAVRLVHPVTDHATGTTRDVIVSQLVPHGRYVDRPTRRASFQRLVPGLNITIPWPRAEPAQHRDEPADTLRIDVEERTFVPTLLRPPVPEPVLDELRNRFSRFRTRHTPEYVAQKAAEEAQKARAKRGAPVDPSMLTPLQEFNRQERERRRALGQPELTDGMLERIGEVIARNRGISVEGVERGQMLPDAEPSTAEAHDGSSEGTITTEKKPPSP